MERVDLSLNSFLGFWYNLTIHADERTGILYKTIKAGKKEHCTCIEDLVRITGATQSSFYRFYREATAKKYIASVNFNVKNKFYILNPDYIQVTRKATVEELFKTTILKESK